MAVRLQLDPRREPPDLLDLEAAGLLSAEVDVFALADLIEERSCLLWDELTATVELGAKERHFIDRRIRRLNELGFDVGELIIERSGGTAEPAGSGGTAEPAGSGGTAERLRVTPPWSRKGTTPASCADSPASMNQTGSGDGCTHPRAPSSPKC